MKLIRRREMERQDIPELHRLGSIGPEFNSQCLKLFGAFVLAGQDLRLQRYDVHRRAEPRFGLRLYQRVMDAEMRSDLRICLPTAAPHGEDGAATMHPQE